MIRKKTLYKPGQIEMLGSFINVLSIFINIVRLMNASHAVKAFL